LIRKGGIHEDGESLVLNLRMPKPRRAGPAMLKAENERREDDVDWELEYVD